VIDLIGWFGNVGYIIGLPLIAKKRIGGFYFCIFGNVCYLIISILLKLTSSSTMGVVMIILNTHAIIQWKKKNES